MWAVGCRMLWTKWGMDMAFENLLLFFIQNLSSFGGVVVWEWQRSTLCLKKAGSLAVCLNEAVVWFSYSSLSVHIANVTCRCVAVVLRP